ncbi:tight adherence protein C [Actinacidiphila glaucinigra]|uniref:Tight adherence protein C n=1 Tax=Actinacidiphila glaucinigra TaxID=235986 RepID=A0A239F439_9ACTN|nr:tight adherence protein C [Actinacidiphila glaucinigra]
MITFALAAVAALGVVGVCYGIGIYRSEVKLPGDLQLALEVGRTRTTKVGNAVDRLGMRWAPLVLRLMGPARVNRIRTRIDHAGHPYGLTVDRYAARRAVYGALGALAALVLLQAGHWFVALLMVAYGLGWTDLGIRLAVRRRRDEIERTLPDFLDVLAVVVSAGLGFRQALERVSTVYKGPWSDEIRIALRQMDVGVSRRDAFDQLRRRNGSEQVGQFVTALQQGEELGAPIARTLLQIATDMRRTEAQNARRRAARTVPRATGVVTTLLVPATMILLMTGTILGSRINFGELLG